MDYSRLPIALVIVAAMFFVVFLMPNAAWFQALLSGLLSLNA